MPGGQPLFLALCAAERSAVPEPAFFAWFLQPGFYIIRITGCTVSYKMTENRPMQNTQIRHRLLLLFFFLFGTFTGVRAQLSAPLLEWRDDTGDTTTKATVHLLARTAWPARVTINGDSCHLYRTGIFFRTVALQPGPNLIQATVKPVVGEEARFSRTIFRRETGPRAALPLWIDSTSVLPAESRVLQSRDRLRVSFIGAKGHAGWVDFKPGKLRLYLRRTDLADCSRYEGEMPLSRLQQDKEYSLQLCLKNSIKGAKKSTLRRDAGVTIVVQNPERFPLLQLLRDGALLNQSLGYVRLGPPVISELPAGTILQSSGRIGSSWRIRLDEESEGYVAADEVEALAEPALRPAYYITTLSAAPAAGADLVTIPRLQPVPFSLHPDPAGRVLRLRLYGVESSSTWITHREGLRVMDRLSWEQIAPQTYQVNIHLQESRIWGYTLTAGPTMLELRLKHPPAGKIKVAIEAGHGGSNLGAVGLSGLLEKQINLDVAQRLEKLCLEAGLQVLQVRETDTDMSLGAKKERVEASDADLLVSIHANAGGTANGYLGANGVSTYYHNPFWGDLARVVYKKLLELPLQEFGCVGSFNYRVTRMSSRPAILVEMAFLSHAGDEEKLFLPEFRQQLAEKILAGINSYLESPR